MKLKKFISERAVWQIATALALVGIVLLWVSKELEGANGDGVGPFEVVIRDLGALFVVSGAVSVLWDLRGRRALASEVLAAARVASDVESAGLARLTDRHSDIEWSLLLRDSHSVDLFFLYATTWRANNAVALREFVARKKSVLRVVLPNPDDDVLVQGIAARLRSDSVDVARRIREASADIQSLTETAHETSSIEVRYSPDFPIFTYYRFDRTCIGVLYPLTPGRVRVPALQVNDEGFLGDFFSQQFCALWEQAESSEVGEGVSI